MKAFKIPNWWEAPPELFEVEGHCGVLVSWMVLAANQKTVAIPELVRCCRHTKRHGVFAVSLAAALKESGLNVSFHTEPDFDMGGFERRCYGRAHRIGVIPQAALSLPDLLKEQRKGRLPIVLFNTDDETGHFSLLLGRKNGKLQLPLAKSFAMSDEDFLLRWSAPGILRQCVLVG